MHFSEDELRAALKRQDPGPQFTQRVMASLNQAAKEPSVQRPAGIRPPWLSLRRLRRALAGVLGMVILLAGGLGYWQHQENERKRQQELVLAREAERQAIVALRIANDKLNRVFQRVKDSQQAGAKAPLIQKERL